MRVKCHLLLATGTPVLLSVWLQLYPGMSMGLRAAAQRLPVMDYYQLTYHISLSRCSSFFAAPGFQPRLRAEQSVSFQAKQSMAFHCPYYLTSSLMCFCCGMACVEKCLCVAHIEVMPVPELAGLRACLAAQCTHVVPVSPALCVRFSVSGSVSGRFLKGLVAPCVQQSRPSFAVWGVELRLNSI